MSDTKAEMEVLQANLYMFATDFESLKGLLTGYSEWGMYEECLYGIRDEIVHFPEMILSGKLPLATIAKIFEFFYLMESLARYPADTHNFESFKGHPYWQQARQLAGEAADLLEDCIRKTDL